MQRLQRLLLPVFLLTSILLGVPATGNAASPPSYPSAAPAVSVTRDPSSAGYWITASDGGVFSFGGAGFYGSMGGKPLNKPIVGMAATPSGHGYWEVASDGGIFAFGDAGFYGSMGGKPLNSPVVGVAGTPTGKGYWEVGSDGGIFAFGDAVFYGSMGGKPLNAGVVSMTATPSGAGYLLVGADGGVFAFGNAVYAGRITYTPPAPTVSGNDLRTRIVQIARSQLGVHETANNCNPYGPCEPWCSLFATWDWQQAGVNIPRYGYAGSIWTWNTSHQHQGMVGTQPGDAILHGSPSNTTHVDLVESVNTDGSLTVIGGNWADAVTRHVIARTGNDVYGYVNP